MAQDPCVILCACNMPNKETFSITPNYTNEKKALVDRKKNQDKIRDTVCNFV